MEYHLGMKDLWDVTENPDDFIAAEWRSAWSRKALSFLWMSVSQKLRSRRLVPRVGTITKAWAAFEKYCWARVDDRKTGLPPQLAGRASSEQGSDTDRLQVEQQLQVRSVMPRYRRLNVSVLKEPFLGED
jgi:hypothetical protein